MSAAIRMPAGRELDALIAERVMGWAAWRSPAAPKGSSAPDCWRTGWRRSPTIRLSGWNPSTDITRAWQVMELLLARDYGVILSNVRAGAWTCEIDRATWRGSEVVTARTAPLAICLAALFASEVPA